MNDLSTIREILQKALRRNNYNNGGIKDDVRQALAALSHLKASAGEPVEVGQCDYRKKGCINDGITINGKWVCKNHIPSPSPAPVELSAEDMYRLAREVFPPDTTNDGEPWYTDRQSTMNIGAKKVIRHITKHYTLYPKQP